MSKPIEPRKNAMHKPKSLILILFFSSIYSYWHFRIFLIEEKCRSKLHGSPGISGSDGAQKGIEEQMVMRTGWIAGVPRRIRVSSSCPGIYKARAHSPFSPREAAAAGSPRETEGSCPRASLVPLLCWIVFIAALALLAIAIAIASGRRRARGGGATFLFHVRGRSIEVCISWIRLPRVDEFA